MIVDGRKIAGEILAEVKAGIPAKFDRPLVVRAVTIEPKPATLSYLRIKSARAEDAGMQLDIVRLPKDALDGEVIDAIHAPGADAVIVQLPLPDTISTSLVLDEIPLELDADVLSTAAYERFAYAIPEESPNVPILLPPVVEAVREILKRANVTLAGKRAVVVGAGRLVGQPVATWLEREGTDISVITLENSEEERLTHLAQAEIIVSGAGSPHLIKPEHIRKGVVLIDAGTSESSGAIAGDADPACAQKASVFTPVPGGLGPIAVACLFRNVALLAGCQFAKS